MKTSRPENGSTQTTQTANTQNRQHYLFTPFAKGISLLLFVAAIILSCFTATPPQAKAQEKEHKPCLVLYEEYYKADLESSYKKRYGKEYDPKDTTFFYNPYKVMVDTCDKKHVWPPPVWITHYFRVEFEHNVIPRKEKYENNKLIYYTWEDILDKYKECKEGFKKLEEKFGKFKLVDGIDERGIERGRDTTFYEGEEGVIYHRRKLNLQFENYVCSVDAYYAPDGPIAFLEKIDLVMPYPSVSDFGWSGSFLTTNINIIETPQYNYLSVYPNTANNEITITLSEKDIMFPKEINIYDNTGKLVKILHTGLEHDQDINISNLPNGYYFVQVGNSIGKFIIAR